MPLAIVRLMWMAWLVSWFAAAAWSDRTVMRPGMRREIAYRVLTLAGALLLFGLYPRRLATEPMLWSPGPIVAWTMVTIAGLGLLFTWWARIYLGRLWSSNVTRKEHHRIVDTGPYGLVRHPIYTGVILAILASAALHPLPIAIAGALLITAGIYLKARLEETFLREQLGEDTYAAYVRRVPMLVPFVRTRIG